VMPLNNTFKSYRKMQ